ncbi:glycosyltransferase family 4 protein [Candidatus Roizmanbacteria bacterium]|nr:glycosyltransferase family 4 protein [Candidatus Roizmanbacteria bacterium]
MKIGFYTPYLNILGGGERYILQMANMLSEKHQVDIFGDKIFKRKAQEFFGLDLEKVNFVADIFRGEYKKKIFSKLRATNNYDRFFYVTDGSLLISLAKKNYLIIQVPQREMYKNDLLTRFKLSFWQTKLVYSNYVKYYIDRWWNTDAQVFPPAIDTRQFKTGPKDNIILSVGRFFPLPHSKKQEVLVDAFKILCQKGLRGWKLILAGGVDEQGKEYFNMVKKRAKGFPVEIQTNLFYSDLLDLYSCAKIYWHAAGFGEDLDKHPERAEHFGITTLEAMASGCVPLVFSAGGQKEIVNDGTDGLSWNTKEELVQKTTNLINNLNIWDKLSKNALEKSKEYDIKRFEKKLISLIKQ